MKNVFKISYCILACSLIWLSSCTTKQKKAWAGPFSFMVKEWHPYYMEKANQFHVQVGLAKRVGDSIDEKIGRDKSTWPLFDKAQELNYYFDSWRGSEYYAKTLRVVDAYKQGEISKTQAQLMIDQYQDMHKLAFDAAEREKEQSRRERVAEVQRKNEQRQKAFDASWNYSQTMNDPQSTQSDKNRALMDVYRNPYKF